MKIEDNLKWSQTEFLKQIPLFVHFSLNQLENFIWYMSKIRIIKGAKLVWEGEKVKFVSILFEGEL